MASYYCDTAADAGGDGTTQNLTGGTCAFKTVAQVNEATFAAGDSVLFKRGETWREQLTVPSSGSAGGGQVTIGAYGTGALPIINGANALTTWDQTGDTLGSKNIFSETWAATGAGGYAFTTAGAGRTDLNGWVGILGSGSVIDGDNKDITDSDGGAGEILKIQKVSANFNSRVRWRTGGDNEISYLSFRVNITAEGLANTEKVYIARGQNTAFGEPYNVKLYKVGTDLKFGYGVTNDGAFALTYSGAISLNTWYHIEVMYDNTNHLFAYKLDGVSVGSGSITGTHYTGPRDFLFGDNETSETVTMYIDNPNASTDGWQTGFVLGANQWRATSSTSGPVWFVAPTTGAITWGVKKTVITDADAEYDYYTDGTNLVVYAAATPATRYASVEAGTRNICVTGAPSNYVTVQDVEVKFAIQAGISTSSGTNWLIDRCTAHHVGIIEDFSADGILNRGVSNTIQNCTAYENGRHGIFVQAYTGFTITSAIVQNNTVYNNYHSQIDTQCQGGTYNGAIIRFNHVYLNADFPATHDSMGIVVIGTGAAADHPTNVDIYYNIIHDISSYGIFLYKYADDVDIYNNVIFRELSGSTISGGSVGLYISDNTPTDIVIENNIIGGFDKHIVVVEGDSVAGCDYNVYTSNAGTLFRFESTSSNFADWKTASSLDAASIVADPLFVNAAASDFRLLLNSPCRNKGVNVSLTTDYAGNTVPAWTGKAPDMGCYENRPNGVAL